MARDENDLEKVSLWIDEMNPFNENHEELQSVTSGLTADASVNYDDVKFIGQKIQKTFDTQDFVKCSFKSYISGQDEKYHQREQRICEH